MISICTLETTDFTVFCIWNQYGCTKVHIHVTSLHREILEITFSRHASVFREVQ